MGPVSSSSGSLDIGLYLSWTLDPFVHGRLQNLKISEDPFGHDVTPFKG